MCIRVRGGELFDYLASRDVFEEEEAITFMKQLLDGLGYLHKCSVVHLDIKVACRLVIR